MNRAIELSIKNVETNNGGPFGAVIVKDNIIIGEGVNCVVKNNDPSAHAEVMAVRAAADKLKTFDLSDCVIYSSCQPCSMCYSVIRWARIDKIFYSNTRYDAAEIGFSDVEIYHEIQNNQMKIERLYLPDSKKAFELWVRDKKNIHY
jgi:tRNA(Arg) A34 adenosine deaminase TadA